MIERICIYYIFLCEKFSKQNIYYMLERTTIKMKDH